jgi:hypothetical protein
MTHMMRSLVAAAALLVAVTSTTPALAQADSPTADRDGLSAADAYFAEIYAMQQPLFDYINKHPGLDMSDPGFVAGYAPIVEEAAARARAIVPPDCLVPTHEHFLAETQHRLDALSAVQSGDLLAAYDHVLLAEDAADAGLVALDAAVCGDDLPTTETETVLPPFNPEEYAEYIAYVGSQGLFLADTTTHLEKLVVAKSRRQLITALTRTVGTASSHLRYLAGVTLHICLADLHHEWEQVVRGFHKYTERELDAVRDGKVKAARSNHRKASEFMTRAFEVYDPHVCESLVDRG